MDMLLVLMLLAGTTSQRAFERCGETHLTVRNNLTEPIEVIMFGRYEYLLAGESTVFWTNEEVEADRVTRRRIGQHYHTSVTSAFEVEQRECTQEWAVL